MTNLEDLTELLQNAHDTVEGNAFSPDSGVSSCSDSEPSSPTLSRQYTQLTNADISAYNTTDGEGMSPEWMQYQGSYWSTDDSKPEFQQYWLPTCVSEQTSHQSAIKGEWVETKAGFQVCDAGNGNVQVRLGGGITYDIDVNSDIGDTITQVVKTEMTSETTPAPHGMDVNNNVDSSAMFTSAHPADSCNTCYHNKAKAIGMNHCIPYYHDVHYPHPHVREDSAMDRLTPRKRPSVTRTERLWEFILRLLGDHKYNPCLIEWVDREDGTFRLNNSKAIAHMWGMRKNNVQMTYEKLSRALRYYYHRQILEPVLGKKLVYRFGPNAVQVWEHRIYKPQGSR